MCLCTISMTLLGLFITSGLYTVGKPQATCTELWQTCWVSFTTCKRAICFEWLTREGSCGESSPGCLEAQLRWFYLILVCLAAYCLKYQSRLCLCSWHIRTIRTQVINPLDSPSFINSTEHWWLLHAEFGIYLYKISLVFFLKKNLPLSM